MEFISAVMVGFTAFALQNSHQWLLTDMPQKKLQEQRKKMLLEMLAPANMPFNKSGSKKVEWRTFQTLMNVIGADEATAKKLLIEIGARASTKDGAKWALISNKPLTRTIAAESEDEMEENT